MKPFVDANSVIHISPGQRPGFTAAFPLQANGLPHQERNVLERFSVTIYSLMPQAGIAVTGAR